MIRRDLLLAIIFARSSGVIEAIFDVQLRSCGCILNVKKFKRWLSALRYILKGRLFDISSVANCG